MAKEYKNTLRQLSEKLNDQPINTPIQEVRPVEQKPAASPPGKPNTKRVGDADETHVNFWAPTDLVQRLKIYSVTSGKSIKQIIIDALEKGLPK